MKNNIKHFLPEKISDEAAYHLINFMLELSAAIDSLYFAQARRYHLDNFPHNDEHVLGGKDDFPF